MIRFLLLILFLAIIPASASKGYDLLPEFSEEACGTPCVISHNPGGELESFVITAEDMVLTGRSLVINGDCYSACTILADLMRSQGMSCVTPNATFHIHQGTGTIISAVFAPIVNRFEVPYSVGLNSLIERMGGQPKDGWLVLTHDLLRLYFPECATVTSGSSEQPLVPEP
ncbi:MAG: hypothetical protein ABS76_26545 [Pelagibacterium sp. SCN 64-44]|nr:MAG: hypothetical protein ABS76_26545 [Pelagibacterium sp. SCN 64-44]